MSQFKAKMHQIRLPASVHLFVHPSVSQMEFDTNASNAGRGKRKASYWTNLTPTDRPTDRQRQPARQTHEPFYCDRDACWKVISADDAKCLRKQTPATASAYRGPHRYRVAQKSKPLSLISLNRIKCRHYGYIFHRFRLENEHNNTVSLY